MAVSKLENYFKDPAKEYDLIVSDLKSRLSQPCWEEVIAYVDHVTENAMNRVWDQLRHRYESLSRLEDSFPDKPTTEDQQRYIRNFFDYTDPGKVSKDLQTALSFDELESDYIQFIRAMSEGEYGEIFLRYQYPSPFFNGLQQGILLHINNLTNALKKYTDKIGQHAIVMDRVKSDQQGKSIIKGGASLLGLLVGIPFAGAGVGALMGDDSETQIHQSMDKVIQGWNHYIDRFNSFLQELELHYKLAMMALYGGTIIRVNDQFATQRLTFSGLALLTPTYQLTITEQEIEELTVWTKKTTNGIQHLLKYRQWQEAIQVSQKLFQYVKNNPVSTRVEVKDGQSAIYLAHMYYYISYQEALLEEYKNGHFDSFYNTTKQLFQELYLYILDSDVKQLGFHSMSELYIRFIKEAVRRKKVKDGHLLFDYFIRVDQRVGTYGIYYGEQPASKEAFFDEHKAIALIGSFLEDVFDLSYETDSEEDEEEDISLNRKQLKALIKIDNSLQKDELSAYLRKLYWKSILWPWNRSSFQWVGTHKKKLVAGILSTGLITGGYFAGPDLYQYGQEQIQNWSWLNGPQKTESNETNTVPVTTYEITTEYANVRSKPSLDSEIAFVVSTGDSLVYQNNKKVGEEGRVWFQVENEQGGRGWISSKIVVKVWE
ncbi:SH3 domain-containing protein [Gracilibacillus sp. D59]|uniref:SH3 domain-containing protein n=1 Tax=Gracilibacillus sp. D59 TaxID=3457434 RepID=UPI003FCCAAE1